MSAEGVGGPLPRPRDVLSSFGIYVHVPFCVHRCWYCDFNAYSGLDDQAPGYMQALASDARLALSLPEPLEPRPTVTSVFVGGGTPSHVPAAELTAVLDAIRDGWPLAPGCEITIECNPESAAPDKLTAYLAAGATRLSFGVQSLDESLLATLGRAHDGATALRALRDARSSGFEDVNADLIFGIPGESDEALLRSIDGVLDAGVTHVSCYGLTYEEGTPLEAWRRLGKVTPVDDDEVASRWELAGRRLSSAGMERYEISNWSRPGMRCAHNLLYWRCGEYAGLGAGAHSHLSLAAGAATRSWTVKPPSAYAAGVREGRRPIGGTEAVDRAGRAAEVMFLGLRVVEGVDAARFHDLTGLDLAATFGDELEGAARDGLLRWDGTCAALTQRGTLLANEAVGRFLQAPER